MVNLKNMPGASALRGLMLESQPVPNGSEGGIEIRDTGLTGKINLRCNANNKAVGAVLNKVIGTSLPIEPNTYHVSGRRSIVWLAYDEWLLLVEDSATDTIIAEINGVDAQDIAVTNVSDALGGVVIKGVHSRALLAKHCSLDFHARTFTKGMVQQSLLSHGGVIIICLDDDKFKVIGRSSFMPYIVQLLMDGAIEYGYHYKPV